MKSANEFASLNHNESSSALGLGLHVSKHDAHSIDVKINLETHQHEATADVSFFFFMPQNIHLFELEKKHIQADFNSRARLSFSKNVIGSKNIFSQMRDQLLTLLDDPNMNFDSEVFVSAVQHYGSALGEMVRGRAHEHRRELMLAHSLISEIANPSKSLLQLTDWIDACWKLHQKMRERLTPELLKAQGILRVLESYSHQLYIDYIGELLDKLNELKKIVTKQEAFAEGWARVEKVLKRAKEEESRRSISLLALESSSAAVSQEAAILEYSHMKKFFQSTTFVEVVRRESAKKLTEPTAAIGAAVAAVLVTSLERASSSWTSMGSSGGIAVVALGIALYALRDRVKDRFRDYTLRRLKKIIADVDVVLKSQKLVIGRAKEWYMQLKSQELPQEVRDLRRSLCQSESEKFLNEDVLNFKKVLQFDRDTKTFSNRAYLETLRVNFERHLKFLDEPLKVFRHMSDDGEIRQMQSHRVYHIHLCVLGHIKIENANYKLQKVYRLVLDKSGIQRVEQIFL